MDALARTRRLRTGVTWNLVPLFLLAVVGLGLNFAIGRLWGAAALGSFNQVTTAYFVLAAFGAVGINFSVLRAVAEAPDDRTRVGAIALGGLLPSVVLGALVSALFVGVRAPVARLLGSDAVAAGMYWAAPGLFCFIVNKVLFGVVNGLSRMRAYAVYTSLRYLLIAIGLALAWGYQLPAEALPGIWSFSEGLLMLVLLVELGVVVSFRNHADWKLWIGRHLSYGLRGFAAVLLLEINSRLDIWMLGPGFSDAMVGVYSMAANMVEGAAQLAVVLSVNLNPQMAAHLAGPRRSEVQTLVTRTRRWFVPFTAALSLVAVLLYPEVIPWLTGSAEFEAGATPFAILMLGLALSSPWLPFNQILLMGSRPGWHTLYVGVGVATNVLACFFLIPRFGLIGAAMASAAALLVSSLLLRQMVAGLLDVKL
jgi:O-antigen/teichoic acid export membrane protein